MGNDKKNVRKGIKLLYERSPFSKHFSEQFGETKTKHFFRMEVTLSQPIYKKYIK